MDPNQTIVRHFSHHKLGRIRAELKLIASGGHVFDDDYQFFKMTRSKRWEKLLWTDVAPHFESLKRHFRSAKQPTQLSL